MGSTRRFAILLPGGELAQQAVTLRGENEIDAIAHAALADTKALPVKRGATDRRSASKQTV